MKTEKKNFANYFNQFDKFLDQQKACFELCKLKSSLAHYFKIRTLF